MKKLLKTSRSNRTLFLAVTLILLAISLIVILSGQPKPQNVDKIQSNELATDKYGGTNLMSYFQLPSKYTQEDPELSTPIRQIYLDKSENNNVQLVTYYSRSKTIVWEENLTSISGNLIWANGKGKLYGENYTIAISTSKNFYIFKCTVDFTKTSFLKCPKPKEIPIVTKVSYFDIGLDGSFVYADFYPQEDKKLAVISTNNYKITNLTIPKLKFFSSDIYSLPNEGFSYWAQEKGADKPTAIVIYRNGQFSQYDNIPTESTGLFKTGFDFFKTISLTTGGEVCFITQISGGELYFVGKDGSYKEVDKDVVQCPAWDVY